MIKLYISIDPTLSSFPCIVDQHVFLKPYGTVGDATGISLAYVLWP